MLVVAQAVRRGVSRALRQLRLPVRPAAGGHRRARCARRSGSSRRPASTWSSSTAPPTSPRRSRRSPGPGIPVFAQFGITPQTALRYGVDVQRDPVGRSQVPDEMIDELVAEAKRLEAAGAVAAELHQLRPGRRRRRRRRRSRIPVLGGFGGGPWLDGRIRMATAAIGYAASAIDDPPDTYANVAQITLDAITAYAEDVRAGRQIQGGIPVPPRDLTGAPTRGAPMPTAVIDGIATRYEVDRRRPAAADVLARRLRLHAWRAGATRRHLPAARPCRRTSPSTTPASSSTGASPGRPAAGSSGSPGPTTCAQGVGLLDHLGIERAHLMGGCVGCSTVAAARRRPPRPGARAWCCSRRRAACSYRMKQHARFVQHLGVRRRARAGGGRRAGPRATATGFSKDPRVGPVGHRPAQRRRRSPRRTRPWTRTATAPSVSGTGAAAVRPRHGARRRAGGPAGPRHPGAHRARAGHLARALGGALPAGVPAATRSTGTCRWPSRPTRRRRSGSWSSSATATGRSSSERRSVRVRAQRSGRAARWCTPPLNGRVEPGASDLARRARRRRTFAPEHQHVGVVVAAGDLGGEQVWHRPARMPRILLQAITSPWPLPPMTIAAVGAARRRPAGRRRRTAAGSRRPSRSCARRDRRPRGPRSCSHADEVRLEGDPVVVGGDRDAHGAISRPGRACDGANRSSTVDRRASGCAGRRRGRRSSSSTARFGSMP